MAEETRAESLQKYLHRAFINNTYSDKSTHLVLRKAVDHSYQHLYELQKSLVGYEEHYIKITRSVENLRDPNKLYYNKNFKPCININRSEIDICNVRDFRLSEFYNKELTFNDLISHPEIFNRIPIITIDNQTIWNYNLHFTDKYVTLILPVAAKIIFEYERMVSEDEKIHDKRIYNSHDMHIQLVENIYSQQITVAPRKLNPAGSRITVASDLLASIVLPPKLQRYYMNTNMSHTLTKFTEIISLIESDDIDTAWEEYKQMDDVPGKDEYRDSLTYFGENIYKVYNQFKGIYTFNNFGEERHDGILFGSIHFSENIGTNIIEFAKNPSGISYTANLYEDAMSMITGAESVTISFVYIDNMHRHNHSLLYKHFINNDNELELPLMVPMKDEESYQPFSMPIPTENCMVFRKNVDTGIRELVPSSRLKLYYPNIYQIRDYDIYLSSLETDGSVALTVVSDDTEVIDPTTEIRLSDAHEQLPFVKIGDTVYSLRVDTRNETDEYEFYYAYKQGYDLKYTPVTGFYMEFIDTELYTSLGTFEEKLNMLYRDINSEFYTEFITSILTYEAYIHKYGDIDFIHRYKNSTFLSDKIETRKYENDVLRQWVKNEPWVLRDYVVEQHRKNSSYYLYVKTIDLSSHMADSTTPFIPTKGTGDNEDGTNPIYPSKVDEHGNTSWYVFSIVNTEPGNRLNQLRVYVDNLAISDDVFQIRDGYIDYICIPTQYVNDDSFIEIEIMSEFYFEERTTFESMDDTKSFSISSPIPDVQPTLFDFVIYEDNNERLPARYDPDFFKVDIVNEYGEFTTSYGSDKYPLKYVGLTTFNIYPNDEEILNIPVVLRFSKMCEGNRYIVPNNEEVYLEFVDNRFAYHTDFLRVYINGRLIAREKYLFYPMYHHPRIKFLEDDTFQLSKGDVIYIEVTPYRYKQVYYKDDITPADEYYGVLDLKAIITKPFDLRYYDIYINGKKLSINNCIPLDPWSVKLINLTSKYNLLIFEKERDFEYYGVDFTKEQPYPTIEEFLRNHSENTSIIRGFFDQFISRRIPTFKDETTGEYIPIDVNENINTDTPEYYPPPEYQYIYFIFDSFYYEELIGKGFINPDIMQISFMVMKEWFSQVYDTYKTTAYDSSHEDEPNAKIRRLDYIPCISIDPDIYFMEDNINETEFIGDTRTTIAYEVGHTSEVDQSILDEEIVMKTEKTIDKYVKPPFSMDEEWEESDD